MTIQFYNSLTNSLQTFEPLDPPTVRMYSCGPTVYDYSHIGNFRSFIAADLLRRFLELTGHDVKHVMNITDVGHMTEDDIADGGGQDKMQAAAARVKEDKKSGKVPAGAVENPDDPYQVAEFYTQAFLNDARALGLKVANEYPAMMPHATQKIPEMQALIAKLIEREHAYIAADGTVYFSVESFDQYGELSGNTIEKLRAGEGGRISDDVIASKRHPADFMLWKPDASHIMKWDSPWGEGYPGWHIECSAMARQVLGVDTIDIHTGGEDLTFPHHECEIAQSCGATGATHFAKFWIHTRFLLVEGEKMSKRKGSFYTARDVFEGRVTGNTVHPAVLRYELIKTHYGANLNFTVKGLHDSAAAVRKIQTTYNQAVYESKSSAQIDNSHPVIATFINALSDNLNISEALAVVFSFLNEKNANPAEARAILESLDSVLGVLPPQDSNASSSDTTEGPDTEAQTWAKQLDTARKNKDYALADEIRQKIIDAGYNVQTTKDGTVIEKKLA